MTQKDDNEKPDYIMAIIQAGLFLFFLYNFIKFLLLD